MKVGILGDIHGNHFALKSVLQSAKRLRVERLVITGDLVGYYFWPNEVLGLLEGWEKDIVRGNHEDMLITARSKPETIEKVTKRYGSGLEVALNELSLGQLDMLCTLPHPLKLNLEGYKILLAHGAPWDNDCYVYPDAAQDILKRCAVDKVDLVVMGHTHYPMMKLVGNVHIVNPGSVGQPRNRKHGAQWALLDTQKNEVTLRSESYDVSVLLDEARKRHPELPYLVDVMIRR